MNLAILAVLLTIQGTSQQSIPTDQAPAIEYAEPPFALTPSLRDTVLFGWLEVPQDYENPAAGTLRLALAVIRARSAEPAADPIVFVPGGPGMSAVEPWTVEAALSPRIALLRHHRDFVILDPRGHGLSQPHTCAELNEPAPMTADSAAAIAFFEGRLAACRERMEAEGFHPRTLNAIQAAHDIEVLRRALRVEQISLFGASYGTRIVAEALRQHPKSIRAAVFLSPVPPGLPHLTDDVAPEVFAALFSRCAQLSECRNAYPNLSADFDSVIARTRRSPVVVPIPNAPEDSLRLDDRVFSESLAQLLAARSLAVGVPMIIHTLSRHGFEPVIPMAPHLMQITRDDDIAFGTHLAFHCNDSPIALEKSGSLDTLCPLWVGEEYGDRSGEPLFSDIPALIMVGEFDPRTPPSYARHLASGLTRARILEIAGYGHDLQHPCLSGIQRDFYADPERALDTACLDSLPPLRFAAGVVPSRWIARASMHVSGRPLDLAVPGLAALLLLLIPVIGVPVGAVRRVDQLRTPDRVLLWLAAVTAILLLCAVLAAVVVGGRQSMLLPAIGVPLGWSWVLALPWLLLFLSTAALLLMVRRKKAGASMLIRSSAAAGIGLVLAMWAVLSLA